MLDIKENISLKPFTTFDIGGPAEYFVVVENEQEVLQALEFAQQKNLPVFFLGGGSNVLISDLGFNGLVIQNKINGITIPGSGEVKVNSGESWDNVVDVAVKRGLSGVECLSGIPGTAGGAFVQNVGAYGQTFADVVISAKIINRTTGQIEEWSKDKCQFEYRGSYFKSHPDQYFVISFILKLAANETSPVLYHDLEDYFKSKDAVSLSRMREAVIKIRASKGYVVLPGLPSFKSAGSMFKNPVVPQVFFDSVKNKIQPHPSPWFWQLDNGQVKIAAARLLSSAGFEKGFVLGKAGISSLHSLMVVNLDNASENDVMKLVQLIQEKIFGEYGIRLESEVQFVGPNN